MHLKFRTINFKEILVKCRVFYASVIQSWPRLTKSFKYSLIYIPAKNSVYSGLSCINLDDPKCLKWTVCETCWSWHPKASKYHKTRKLTFNCKQLQAPNEAASIKLIVSLSSHLRAYQAVFAYILISHKFQTFLDLFWICKPFLRLNKAN